MAPQPPASSGSIVARLASLFRKKRIHERKARTALIYLFDAERSLGPVTLVDESQGGAKVLAPAADILPMARYALNPQTAVVHAVELVWRSGAQAGLKYTQTTSLRGYIADRRLEHVRDHWVKIASQQGVGRPGASSRSP